jgi:hypothetical protein
MSARLTVVAVLCVVLLAACAEQQVSTPDTLHIVPGSNPSKPLWTAVDQQAAVTWLATHPRKVGRNRHYGIVVASGMAGENWAATLVQPDGKVMFLIDGGKADDQFIQRGDAIEAHWDGYGPVSGDDPPILVAKQAVTLP